MEISGGFQGELNEPKAGASSTSENAGLNGSELKIITQSN